MSQNENSNDIGSMISQLLSDPQKVQQIQQMASSLGLGAAQPQNNPSPDSPWMNTAQNNSPPNENPPQNGMDFSSLLQNFNNTAPNFSEQNFNNASQNNFASQKDFALQNGTNPNNMPPFDLSKLMGALGQNQNQNQNQPQNQALPFDIGAIMKIQRAMQMFTQSNPRVDFLRAIRPLLSEKRAKKVDDAIRIMQLIQVLPLLKESGLFSFGGDGR